MIYADGEVYEGKWFEDKAHGTGVYINKQKSQYEGEWSQDK